MIVSTTIDENGSVTVTCDSDGDQGDGYATDVLEDLAARSTSQAITAWFALHTEADVDEDADK